VFGVEFGIGIEIKTWESGAIPTLNDLWMADANGKLGILDEEAAKAD
jgi:hypothetical protein